MRTNTIAMTLIVGASFGVFGSIALAQQDRYTLKVPNGLAFIYGAGEMASKW